ncbi:hypothetical protein P7C73_g2723, partial [Tremellales sp. Uapishka_1]
MPSALRFSRSIASTSSKLTQRTFSTSRPVRDHFLDANQEKFDEIARNESSAKPILVDFFAAWCQPCRVLTPLLKGVTQPDSGFDLMTIDVDAHPELAAEYKISALPTVVAFKNGKVANKFGESCGTSLENERQQKLRPGQSTVGFKNEADIKKFLGML